MIEDYKDQERIQSIHSSAADICKWILWIGVTGKVSRDRKVDIIRAARRIMELTEALKS